MSSTALYTPEVLGLATSLAGYPLDDALTERADARSRSCGSTLTLGLALDRDNTIVRVGLRAHACAIGQAAAAVFAQGVVGRSADDIDTAHAALAAWLAGDGPMPDWPGLDVVSAARAYPARHGAMLLAWQAARDILSTPATPR